jgi:four helix bundle protein
MNKEELKSRTKALALRVMAMIDHLPNTTKGRVIADQIMRSATSVASNY